MWSRGCYEYHLHLLDEFVAKQCCRHPQLSAICDVRSLQDFHADTIPAETNIGTMLHHVCVQSDFFVFFYPDLLDLFGTVTKGYGKAELNTMKTFFVMLREPYLGDINPAPYTGSVADKSGHKVFVSNHSHFHRRKKFIASANPPTRASHGVNNSMFIQLYFVDICAKDILQTKASNQKDRITCGVCTA